MTTLILISSSAFAAIDDENYEDSDNGSNDGLVEVHYDAEALAPYRERRGNWAGVFGASVEQVLPENFISNIDGSTYGDLYGEKPVSMIQITAGLQYNMSLGSIGAGLSYGTGSVTDSTDSFGLKKLALNFTYTMDALFSDPYVAPYVSGEILKWDIHDEGATQSRDESTSMSTGYKLGVLILMDWLDPDSALRAMNSSGLENTYLDLFVSQYNTSNSEDASEADMKTGLNYGAGLRLEF